MRFWEKLLDLLGIRPAPQPVPIGRPKRQHRCDGLLLAAAVAGLAAAGHAAGQEIERDFYWVIPPQGEQPAGNGLEGEHYIWHGGGIGQGVDRYTTTQPGVYDVHPGYWASDYDELTDPRNRNAPLETRPALRPYWANFNYAYNQSLDGRIERFAAIIGTRQAPVRVVVSLQTDRGQRYVHLANLSQVRDSEPMIRTGDRLTLGGQWVDIDRKRLFDVDAYAPAGAAQPIDPYGYLKVIDGTLSGIPAVAMRGGEIVAAVGTVDLDDGRTIRAIFGEPDTLRRGVTMLRPGDDIAVEGFIRTAGDRSQFFVEEIRR